MHWLGLRWVIADCSSSSTRYVADLHFAVHIHASGLMQSACTQSGPRTLVTPSMTAYHAVQVQMELLQRLVSTHQPWQDGLYKSDDRQLAVLLTADDESLQLIQFLVDTGRESQCGLNLTEVVACSEADFRRRYGQVFEEWLEGRGRAADKSVLVQQP